MKSHSKKLIRLDLDYIVGEIEIKPIELRVPDSSNEFGVFRWEAHSVSDEEVGESNNGYGRTAEEALGHWIMVQMGLQEPPTGIPENTFKYLEG